MQTAWCSVFKTQARYLVRNKQRILIIILISMGGDRWKSKSEHGKKWVWTPLTTGRSNSCAWSCVLVWPDRFLAQARLIKMSQIIQNSIFCTVLWCTINLDGMGVEAKSKVWTRTVKKSARLYPKEEGFPPCKPHKDRNYNSARFREV